MRRTLRSLSTVLIVSGSLMLADAALTLLWQEPVSGLYAKIVQGRLNSDLQKLQKQKTSPLDLAALRKLATEKLRIAFEARKLRGQLKPGEAAGRITIAKIKASYVVVDGTDTEALRKGPGIYEQVPFPGAPGTTAIAGHRTTWLAPFRRINELHRGDKIVVEMPYARLTYAVEMTRIVPPTELSVIHRVNHDRLVLSACHPLYSAAKRFIVFAKLVSEQALGNARI
jgi:sortase A